MRKILVAIASTVMALIMSITALAGCNLVTVNNERDLQQVIATVQIDPSAPEEEIYKIDMYFSFLAEGYESVQSGSKTSAEVFKEIVDDLIKNRIYVQKAMMDFDKGEAPFANKIANPNIADVYNVERYLTDDEILESKYALIKELNDFVETFMPEEEHKVGDTIIGEVRAVPTGATNAVDELDVNDAEDRAEMIAYVNSGIDSNSSSERRRAYNQAIKALELNRLLGEDYKGSLLDSDYYKKNLKNNYETKLLEKYYTCIIANAREKFTWETIASAYEDKYLEQQNWTEATFVDSLKNATASAPILVGANGTYGYVYNLLLGATEEQTAEIDALSTSLTDAERLQAMKEILDRTVIKDLRSSWILSGYDFDGSKFTGDYTLTDAQDSLAFQGQVKHLNPDEIGEEDYKAEYGVEEVRDFTIDEFMSFMEDYLYGGKVSNGEYKANVASGTVTDYVNKVNELLFAFSTDPGSLNTYKGYSITPTNKENWEKAFADAGKELLSMGGNSYVMVPTSYGYHVLFFSESVNIANYDYPTLVSYLNAQEGVKTENEWKQVSQDMLANFEDYEDTDSDLYLLFSEVAATNVNKVVTLAQNNIINTYLRDSDTCVTKYESTYKDLIGE